MKPFVAILLTLLVVRPLDAHPHIFVDTGVEVHTDAGGRVTHLTVTWAYDAFYSLLITEDYGLDSDGDAVLTEAEEAALNGFDMNWDAGFNGDLVATLDGSALSLSRPRGYTTTMSEGRLVTTHLRDVAGTPSLAGRQLVIKPYDVTFYTAYDVTLPVTVEGPPLCTISREVPQMNEELSSLRQMLAQVPPDADPEDANLPNAGGAFATRIEVACSAP